MDDPRLSTRDWAAWNAAHPGGGDGHGHHEPRDGGGTKLATKPSAGTPPGATIQFGSITKETKYAQKASMSAHWATHSAAKSTNFKHPGDKALLPEAAKAHREAARAHLKAAKATDDKHLRDLHISAANHHAKAAKAADVAHSKHPHNWKSFTSMVQHTQKAENRMDDISQHITGRGTPGQYVPFGSRADLDLLGDELAELDQRSLEDLVADSLEVDVRDVLDQLELRDGFVGEMSGSSGAGALLPAGQPIGPVPDEARLIAEGKTEPPVQRHKFKGANLASCEECGQPVTAKVHRSAGSSRAAGRLELREEPAGPSPARRQYDGDLAQVEPGIESSMTSYFGRQRKATISRLAGKRGKTMLRDAHLAIQTRADGPPPGPEGNLPEPPAGPGAAGVDPAAIFDAGFWSQQLAETLLPHLQAAGSIAANRVKHQVDAPDDLNDGTSLASVHDELAKRAESSALDITGTTRDQIFEALQEGVKAGESMQQLTDRINAIFDNADRVRAKTIAQTEAVGALNQAAHTYATNLPEGTVGSKTWLSHHDDRVRPTHREADGQQVALDHPFIVGGSPMMFPGDPAAPPGEVINCRCGVGYLAPTESLKSALGPAADLKGIIPQSSIDALTKVQAEQAAKYPASA